MEELGVTTWIAVIGTVVVGLGTLFLVVGELVRKIEEIDRHRGE